MDRNKWMYSDLLNRVQSMLLIASMAAVLGLTGWLLGGGAISVAAVGLTLFLYFINPLVSPSWIARLHRGRPLQYHEARRLFQILEKLSRLAGLKILPRLYYIPGDGMNAFATGTEEDAAIGISEGLIRRLSLMEVAAILAHEISHLRHNDIRIFSFANLIIQLTHQLSLFGQILLLINLPILLAGGHTVSWTAIFLLIMAPSINMLLQLSLSRTREYRADLGASELLGDPEPLASALLKIERHQNRWLRWMLWPGYPGRTGGGFFQTHPPTAKRIERLLELKSDGKSTHRPGARHSDPSYRTRIGTLQSRPPAYFWSRPTMRNPRALSIIGQP